MDTPSAATPQDKKPLVCVGRFAAEVPPGWHVKHSSQALYRVDIDAIQLKGIDDRQVLAEKLKKLREMGRPPGAPDVVIREFPLAKGTQAIWFHASSEFAGSISLYAQRRFGDHLITTIRQAKRGTEAAAEELVQLVLDAYQPGQLRGFCVGSGGFSTDLAMNESARVMLASRANPDLEATIATATQREPNPTHPLDSQAVSAMGPAVTLSPPVAQAVGPFSGHGRSVVANDKGSSNMQAIWYYPGKAGDALAPMITISMSGETKHNNEMRGAFEHLRNTFRALPR